MYIDKYGYVYIKNTYTYIYMGHKLQMHVSWEVSSSFLITMIFRTWFLSTSVGLQVFLLSGYEFMGLSHCMLLYCENLNLL